MNDYCVYKHTFPNGKVYIGLTRQNPLDRWQGGMGYKNQKLVFNAIKKYGWDNIRHEIVADSLSLSEAHAKEIELIALNNSNIPSFGYNISSGGLSGMGHTVSEAARKKIGDSHRGKPLSEEHKAKLRKAHYGKPKGKWSEERKARIKQMHLPRYKKAIYQYTRDGKLVRKWDSILQVATELGIAQANIIAVCKGKRMSAGGFSWVYADGGE